MNSDVATTVVETLVVACVAFWLGAVMKYRAARPAPARIGPPRSGAKPVRSDALARHIRTVSVSYCFSVSASLPPITFCVPSPFRIVMPRTSTY